jgi:hypothetical protein
MKTFVGHIGALPSVDAAAIRGAVAASVWSDIERSNLATWLPFEMNIQATRAVSARLGPRRTHEFFRSLTASNFETPLLSGLVKAVLRMLGSDPGTMLPWVPKGFAVMFRDCGEWVARADEDWAASLFVSSLPKVTVEDRIWLESVASSLSALFTLAGVSGSANVRDIDALRGTAVFRLRWDPR